MSIEVRLLGHTLFANMYRAVESMPASPTIEEMASGCGGKKRSRGLGERGFKLAQ